VASFKPRLTGNIQSRHSNEYALKLPPAFEVADYLPPHPLPSFVSLLVCDPSLPILVVILRAAEDLLFLLLGTPPNASQKSIATATLLRYRHQESFRQG
jgi:hypothetical protein